MKILNLILLVLILCSFVSGQNDSNVLSTAVPEKISAAALAVRAFGEVEVETQINSEGEVIAAKAIRGHPLLRQTTEEAARKWRFSKRDKNSESRSINIVFRYEIMDNLPRAFDGEKGETLAETHGVFVEPNRMNVTIVKTDLVPKIARLPRIYGVIEERFCELHNVKMKTEILDVIYGLVMPAPGLEDLFEVEEKLFPYANSVIYGGCVVELTERQEVYYCKKCRKAEEEWIKQHRRHNETE